MLTLPLLLGYSATLFFYYPLIRPSMQLSHLRFCRRRLLLRFLLAFFAFAGVAAGAWFLCTREAFWGFLFGSTLIFVASIFLQVPARYGQRFASLVARLEARDNHLLSEDPDTKIFDVMK